MSKENHTAKHMAAWFKKKAEQKKFKDLPDKRGQGLVRKALEQEKAARDAKKNNPLNQPYVKENTSHYVVKVFHGKNKPYYDRKRTVSQFKTEPEARSAAAKVKGADKVTIQHFDGKKYNLIKEDVPTNSMGLSSSTSGPVQTYDPLLGEKDKRKKRIVDMWRRMLGRK